MAPWNFAMLLFSHYVMSNSLQTHGLQPTRLLCPSDVSGKNSGVGCYFLLQGIFPTLGLNPSLLNCKWILFSLSHRGCQRISRERSVIFLNSVSQSKYLLYNLPLVCKLPSCSSICFLKNFLWENVICYPILLSICSVAQLFPTLCKPIDCSPPGPSVHGILQARILEQISIPFSRGSS